MINIRISGYFVPLRKRWIYIMNLLSQKTLSENIEMAWKNTQKEIEGSDILISSEKTLVFKFAMELEKLYDCKNIVIDFEVKLYEKLNSSDKYLDLLVYLLHEPNKKYAIEFKAPMKSENNSSQQTEIRKNIYKDIARLSYLTENNYNICDGYFLMMTNEKPYFNLSNIRDNTFDTANNVTANLNAFEDDYTLRNNYNFKFCWENIENMKVKGRFAWLKYIKVSKMRNHQY